MRCGILTPVMLCAATSFGQGVFPMQRVSAVNESERGDLLRGNFVQLQRERPADFRAPDPASPNALFGEITLAGKRHLIMLDARAAEQHDTLHFDLDGDADLLDETPVGVLKLPADAVAGWGAATLTHFGYIDLPLGDHAFRVFGRLIVQKDGPTMFALVAEEARRGEVKLAGKQFNALMAQVYSVSGDFTVPGTMLQIWPWDKERPRMTGGFDRDGLRTLRREDDDYYTFSTTPAGDELTVKQYDGPTGDLVLGSGGRQVEILRLQGSLRSRDHSIVLDDATAAGYRIPAGDYLPSYMTARIGDISISFSDNYHTDGEERGRTSERAYAIRVRADEPFVLDFADRPTVIFPSPVKDRVYRPGDQVRIAAVLVDEKLDIMIRGIDDLSGAKEQTFMHEGRRVTSYDKRVPMNPKVVVTDSSGREVYNGVMPFG